MTVLRVGDDNYMIIGFSSGCLHKTHDRFVRETFDVFRNLGCNALEIMFHDFEDAEKLEALSPEDIRGFEYVSLHAPAFERIPEGELRGVLEKIERACLRLGIDSVVMHPDKFKDWGVISEFAIPLAIENMDNRKESCKNAEDLRKIFEETDARMVLDLNHCFSNDPSMKLADELIEVFQDRIVEIHLSGFETFHDPLFKTRQQEILEKVFDKDILIIIESGCETVEDAKKEYAYIKEGFEE